MITAGEVSAAFKAILNRAPESQAVVAEHMRFESVSALCHALTESAEFKASLFTRFGMKQGFDVSQLDEAARAFETDDRAAWQRRALTLPSWVDPSLDPRSTAFREQTLALWREITGRPSYDAAVDEQTPEIGTLDAIRRPAFYASRDFRHAGGQLMAMGHILLRSGLRAGDRVLEYGAGFGQTALAMARLGARVDTVDVNADFCGAVKANADLFDVELMPHVGQFGCNPAGEDNAYDLVFFYESFHHCLEFHDLIPRLRQLLKADGRVILAGEPIFDEICQEMPYSWGFRLDWENVAVMRLRGWMELGFHKAYLLSEFEKAGFDCTLHTDPNSHWAQVYEFRQRG